MASLQNPPSLYHTLLSPNSFPQAQMGRQKDPVRSGRRQLIGVGVIAPWVSLVNQTSSAFAAETKKGFLLVTDKKDGYSFIYPFGWQEVVIEGQDKVFKDVIEPLESVSVNMIPTNKQDNRDFGPSQQVAETLIKRVLAPPSQKTKLVKATEYDVDGKVYYTFELIAQGSKLHSSCSQCNLYWRWSKSSQ